MKTKLENEILVGRNYLWGMGYCQTVYKRVVQNQYSAFDFPVMLMNPSISICAIPCTTQ